MRLVLLGAPGSGKGTQAAKLVQRFGLRHVSTGDIFRKAISDRSSLGCEAKRYLDEGLLVPDSIVLGMIGSILDELFSTRGFILDGFPRTVAQAEQLDHVLANQKQPLDAVVDLKVADEVLFKRLLARKRGDDTEETIRVRLKTFREQTEPLRHYYALRNRLKAVEGARSVEEVFESIVEHLS
ncbi:MAG: adenylate kinase [Myxococcaceae bacterium]|nr:adenylate kinase [Myxococcaceae bacterium]MBH2005906.1 adenylate kinase [Myxococcaceae bacterium]